MEFKHIPVLASEVIKCLQPYSGGIYVDGTLGGGGHSRLILEAGAPDCELIGIDQDKEAIAAASANLAEFGDRKTIVRANFSEVTDILAELKVPAVDGILLDIGVSSHQIDAPERGFSYMVDAPLDMRMDQDSDKPTAADLLQELSETELADLIYKYGEERYSRRIAKQIIWARAEKRIETTFELVDLIRRAMPKGIKEDQHPAKRTFQALRIATNNELGVLESTLDQALPLLKQGGRLAVITFHSLEDRIVKDKFKAWAAGCICPPEFPVCVCGHKPEVKIITRKPMVASAEDLALNSRAHSAKLRCVEKL